MRILRSLFLVFFFSGLFACSHTPESDGVTSSEGRAEATPVSDPNKVQCTQNNDVRALVIQPLNADSCNLLYTKFGSEKSVASGTTPYCKKVSEQIRANLTRSGFRCE